jgi:hypothetical protein
MIDISSLWIIGIASFTLGFVTGWYFWDGPNPPQSP